MPPGSPASERLHHLPEPATPLVGRTRELAQLRQLVLSPTIRLINLVGPGGTGKTRLALAVAAELGDDFRDGVWFVTLAALRDAHLVLPTVAQALGINERPGEGVGVTVASELRARRLLLVLDNLEQVAEAAVEVAALLESCGSLKVLVTSRTVLHVYGEYQYHVPPLALPAAEKWSQVGLEDSEAVRLFLQRAEAAHSGFRPDQANLAVIAEICARLDGLPLAIELAAARSRVLPPAALRARLSRRLELLTGGPRNVPERQQTLRNAIDWSYELLDEAEQRLFRRLCAFAGGCTLDQAEAVCDPSADIVTRLAALVDRSLLECREGLDGETRFTQLETIREYAAERLESSGEAFAVREAHAQLCVTLAERAESELVGPDQAVWVARLEAESENMRAALGWTLDRGPRALGVRLAGCLWRFWDRRGYLTEGQQWLDRAVAIGADGVPPAWRAKALAMAGNLAHRRGEHAVSRSLLEESLAVRRALGEGTGIGASLNNLGNLAFDEGDYSAAADLYGQALAMYRTAHDRQGACLALNNLGIALRECGRLDEAEAALTECLALARAQGDEQAIALATENMGRLVLEQGDRVRAAALLRDGLMRSRAVGSRLFVPLALEDLARIAAHEGRLERAARLWGAAEAVRERLALPLPPHRRERHAAAIAAARARLDEARFAAGLADGRALSTDEAIALALESDVPADHEPALQVLSAREREVAALIAQGKTSKEIAEELVISERTADSHADHIRQKLDLRSRAAIADWVNQRGVGRR